MLKHLVKKLPLLFSLLGFFLCSCADKQCETIHIPSDIEAYVGQYKNGDTLRFIAVNSSTWKNTGDTMEFVLDLSQTEPITLEYDGTNVCKVLGKYEGKTHNGYKYSITLGGFLLSTSKSVESIEFVHELELGVPSKKFNFSMSVDKPSSRYYGMSISYNVDVNGNLYPILYEVKTSSDKNPNSFIGTMKMDPAGLVWFSDLDTFLSWSRL